ncbi:RNA-binding protein Musashi homolog 2-like [Ananas comosus]|uniref:Heterogeneous nuclear ribonucleoprotein 1 n=1 Tax=Ananas comosus TaxID=4615 RepID=A0A199W8Z2_ANACO|nr:RNA-binding protein Musashi homolog 2-like [Ananas comosus]XP_020104240.1 RNA-binding protein Musashi homolog 2-like [Ananas comosus]XP_020104242.1 RNA-binding protein Musashi homolog 2-like [Ananas comosus]XP_020104243.1 RNA-binding protein Musashi homolog 2-like [Ananas comosus]XP_020104244.1 RNA-binding protein Musashi homolog 2-like [Ananas comosus]OAY85937.1 Heterogeneous nuclear ribonucleoprotein 1 [Ananas comosus]
METDHGKLFIGGISWETNEDRLREYFQSFGEVVEAVIMRDRTTGRARGFGFIVFADPSVAERVVMEKHMIDGRMVEAKKAIPRDDNQALNKSNGSIHGSSPSPGRTKKIFVGGLPSTVTEADFKQYFDQFGTIVDVVVMYDHNTQRPRGFGFITFDSEDAVDRALLKTFHELNGKMVEVKRAVPKELSPGVNTRSPNVGYNYNYGMSRGNSFLTGYNQGLSPSSIGGYGMRMDGRLGLLAGARSNGYSLFGPGYGIGMNFEPGINPSFDRSRNFNNNLNYGQQLNPYYGASSSRFNSNSGYSGGSDITGSMFSSVARNIWSDGSLNYTTNSSNSFTPSGSGNIGRFVNNSANWESRISSHGLGGYGVGENRSGLDATNYGMNSGSGAVNTSFNLSGNGNADSYGGSSSIYGDTTWRSASSELDGSAPFGYRLGN